MLSEAFRPLRIIGYPILGTGADGIYVMPGGEHRRDFAGIPVFGFDPGICGLSDRIREIF